MLLSVHGGCRVGSRHVVCDYCSFKCGRNDKAGEPWTGAAINTRASERAMCLCLGVEGVNAERLASLRLSHHQDAAITTTSLSLLFTYFYGIHPGQTTIKPCRTAGSDRRRGRCIQALIEDLKESSPVQACVTQQQHHHRHCSLAHQSHPRHLTNTSVYIRRLRRSALPLLRVRAGCP